ncbi:MAG: response regulator [Planctomycetota bacterium]
MPEIHTLVPKPTRPSSEELVASAFVVVGGSLLAFRGWGIVGALGYLVVAAFVLAGQIANRRRTSERQAEEIEKHLLERAEEAEEARRAEAHLRAKTRQLEARHEELMRERELADLTERAKTEFVADLSREIRTPLNGILGMSGILMDTDLSEDQRDYARTIRSSSETLLSIVDDVLAITQIETGTFELQRRDFDLSCCIENVIELWSPRATEKGVRLKCTVDPTVPHWGLGDRGHLRQNLLTLVGNAVQSATTGEVVLTVEKVRQDVQGVVVRFAVTDPGPALSREALASVFDGFAPLEVARSVGGLSLALGRRIARMMGGDMGAESIEGIGTTFWFTARLGVARRAVTGGAAESETSLRGMRLLLIDGSPETCETVLAHAARWSAEADFAHTASTAIRKLKDAEAAGRPFEVALVDSDLPDISGRDLAEVLKEVPEANGLKFVLIRPVGKSDKPTDLVRLGFDAWLSKPVTPTRLRNVLLHVRTAPEGNVQTARAEQADSGQLGYRVLLAEDNIVNQKVTKLLLAKLGCEVQIAETGMGALEHVISGDYDIVLMDCHMPEMDGFEATKAIRKLTDPAKREIPIVAMTANAMQGDRERCLEAGMNDYIAKPAPRDELTRVIREWASEPPVQTTSTREEEAMTEPEPSPALDMDVIDSLKELGGEDDPEIFIELVELFLSDTPERISCLQKALEEGDAQALEGAAHALKSSCGNLGAISLSALCREIESCGRNADLDSAESLVSRSEHEFTRVQEALRAQLG